MVGLLVVVVCVLVFGVVCIKTYTAFDKKIVDISHKRDNGKIEEREDGVYMYYNGDWYCIDKKYNAEITYVSPLDMDKIISDFNRGVDFSAMKGKMH